MKNVMSRIQLSNINSEIKLIEVEVKEKEAEILRLRKEMIALRDRSAAIRDARAGIYDKWYRNHREDNSSYDKAWNIEKECMVAEGYEDGWQVIEG